MLVDLQPKSGTEVVFREAMVGDTTPLRSMLMPETRTSSREGLELLDDNLINPTFMFLSMESWCHTEQWIKVQCQYPEVILHH